ncbi:aminotransferase class III-fold pyridoxal phosphate-dependent enzyme [Bowmanella sp. Y26]|uniref:aminotransferase n=1 Tax=Bowmanella yangjiangensis TaxID=2811230 RepID=UPI001BDC2E50|nr:aminotransferase [Bowmanella yangjiangensis]MBT1065404.1 aminotransferase class III-fold pyridoxal phosphate-dependent enzyme [Bowmanella yangjiangensis]
MKTLQEWQAADAAHHLHPFTNQADINRKGSRVISHAQGAYIFEANGHRLLDGMSGLWCCNLGYSQPRINQAIAAQLEELPYYNTFFQCTHPRATELAQAISDKAPAHLNRVFFTNSGSEANDSVLRLIHRYWDARGKPQRKAIIARQNAYHGSTIGGASLGGMGFMHEQFEPLGGIHHIPQPYWFEASKDVADMDEQSFGLWAANQLEQKILALGPDHVAAFFAEPIQGAGGVIIPPDSYWPRVQEICQQYGVLLVVDEVIFGFGRTGEWFASQFYQLEPDFIVFAKGITNGFVPLGGVLVSDRVSEALLSHTNDLAHGFTYSGHPVACAAALATLEILAEGHIDKVKNELSQAMRDYWLPLADHPLVGQARCKGLVGALELVKDKSSKQRFAGNGRAGTVCRDMSLQAGLVMRATGDTMIIAPPFILDRNEIKDLTERAWQALDLAQAQLQQ